ncbi:MAG: adenosylcobinamide-phosphate synthase [Betaproteobacteria bacterium]|jgi:adenosylcobinamide-phosphate synthase|nr:adenosylcobinamide-phosphate synthase [Betaproteobacteria bacterium]
MRYSALFPFLVMSAALLVDRLAGEPRVCHPLIGFGRLAMMIERRLRRGSCKRALGILAVAALIVPLAILVWFLSAHLGPAFDIAVLYLAIAPRSLEEHAFAVAHALRRADLDGARNAVGKIVSRDTGSMSTSDVARAAVESTLENGNDAAFGALFWFLVLGAPGAVAFRLANTLDAMWGYRNETYREFGWAAARLDDVLNLLPARLTALTYCIVGDTSAALRCWKAQAAAWYSPNAGPVMAAGAGALRVQLGGAASYGGQLKERPALGCGAPPDALDIARAVALVRRGIVVWTTVVAVLCLASALA